MTDDGASHVAGDGGSSERSSTQRRAANDDPLARDLLLEATARIIGADGLGAATSRRITQEAGVNLGAITYYFGSKDALVAAALNAELERLVEPVLELLETDADPGERLLTAVQQLLGRFSAERDRAPAYLAALLESARSSDDATGRSPMRRLRERLASVLVALREVGEVPAWVEPDAMAALLLGAANGIVLQSLVDPDGTSVEQSAAQLALLLLSARPQP